MSKRKAEASTSGHPMGRPKQARAALPKRADIPSGARRLRANRACRLRANRTATRLRSHRPGGPGLPPGTGTAPPHGADPWQPERSSTSPARSAPAGRPRS